MYKSIFSYLTSYVPSEKRNPKEDYLTQVFAWMLKNIDGYAESYVEFLTDKIANANFSFGEKIDISTQYSLPNGRIDLLIRIGNKGGFICEHKVYSDLSENQIQKYMDNARSLGNGEFYSVLVTLNRTPHTQAADISITWSDVCEFTERMQSNYDSENLFMLSQFVIYLKENGMGASKPVSKESLLGYWEAVVGLEKNLHNLFTQVKEQHDWKSECSRLTIFRESNYKPTLHETKWGRLGIDFYDYDWGKNLSLGLFAGVLLDWKNHNLYPLDTKKGPDFVILVDYNSKDDKKDKKTGREGPNFLSSEWYLHKVDELRANSGTFQFTKGTKENPWRILVLRKPLYDVLEKAYTKDEQINALIDAIVEGLSFLK